VIGVFLFAIVGFWAIKLHLISSHSDLLILGSDNFQIGINPDNGRFFPLTNLSVYHLAREFGLYAIPIYKFFICFSTYLILSYSLRELGFRKANDWWVFFIILSPTFLLNMTTVFNSETDILLAFSLAVLCLVKFFQTSQLRWGILYTLALLIASLLKESVVISLGGLVAILILFRVFPLTRSHIKFYALTLLPILLFSCLYLVFIVLAEKNIDVETYGIEKSFDLVTRAKVIFSLITNDPFVTILAIFVFFDLCRAHRKSGNSNVVIDILAVWGCCYLATYVLLGMYATNYALPAYVLLLPKVIDHWCRQTGSVGTSYKVSCIGLSLLFSYPLSVNIISNNISEPRNFFVTMQLLESTISSTEFSNILVSGVKRTPTEKKQQIRQDRGVAYRIWDHLKTNGHQNFDVTSDQIPEKNFPKTGYKNYEFSWFKNYMPADIAEVDVVLIPPHANWPYQDLVKKYSSLGFAVAHEVKGVLHIPNYSMTSFIKEYMVNKKIGSEKIKDKNTRRTGSYIILTKR